MLPEHRPAFHREAREIGRKTDTQLGRHTRRQIASLRRRAEQRIPIGSAAEHLGDGGREGLGIVLRESGVLEHQHRVGTVLRERRRLGTDTGGTGEQRMHASTAG